MALRLRRGTNTQRTDITPAEGELIYVTDHITAGVSPLWIGDGTTVGGTEVSSSGGGGGGGITDIVNDTTPQLGGNLDVNGNDITGTGDISITGDITAVSGTVSANTFTGNLTGNVTGNLTGDVAGSVVGPVTGNVTGNLTGDVTGDVVGNLTGDVTGDVTGNLTGNINATGSLVGDLVGSVFADDSTALVDGIDGKVAGDFIGGNITIPDGGLNFNYANSSDPYAEVSFSGLLDKRMQLELARKLSGGTIADSETLVQIEHIADDSTGYNRILRQYTLKSGTYWYHNSAGNFVGDDVFTLSEGDVGIGTSSPTSKLHVAGNALITGEATASAFKGTFVADDSTILVDGVAGNLSLVNNNISDLSDVATTSPSVNEILKWDGAQWAPSADISSSGSLSATISGATQANPVVVTTSAAHGFTNSSSVTITDVVGMTELNGNSYFVNVLTGTTFSLYSDSGLSASVDGTGFTPYGSAGSATQAAGTDATTLGGFAGSYYLDYTNATNAPTISAFGLTLIDDVNAATARTTLGLGTAAESASGDFATAAQGALADTAVQPAALGAFEFAGSAITTTDSSNIAIDQNTTFSQDVTVQGVITGDGSGITGIEGLSSRGELSGSTSNIGDGVSADVDITGTPGYMLYKIQTDAAAWVRIYVSDAARTADASRTEGQDPASDAGVVAEVITTGAETIVIAPGVIGFNNESPVTNNVACAVTNKSGGVANITVTLTAVELEV